MASKYYYVGPANAGGSSDEPILGPNGTAAAPTYSFLSDPDTGMYLAAANTLGFSTAGTVRGQVNGDGNWGFGVGPMANQRVSIAGVGNTNAAYALVVQNLAGSSFLAFRNDGQLEYRGAQLSLTGSNPIIIGSSGTLRVGNISAFAGGSILFPSVNTGQVAFLGPSAPAGTAFSFDKSISFFTENGASVNLKSIRASTTLSGATTNLAQIPAGAIVLAVTARVTTTITSGDGATSWTWGDGTTADLYGTGVAFASGTTANGTGYNSAFTPKIYTSATDTVATATGGTFSGGVIETFIYYFDVTAPAS